MTLLIDPPAWPAHGRCWSHLASDTSLAELHAAARALGIPERAFEGDHYDVPDDLYERALAAGAEPVSTRSLLLRLRAAGLRRPKRRGEKVLAASGGPRERVDVVLAGAVPAPHGRHAVVVLDGTGTAVRTAGAGELPDWDPRTAPAPPAHVLGFRRSWSSAGGTRSVRHDGLFHLPEPPAAGPLPGRRWAPLDSLHGHWCRPLLVAAGLAPA